MRLNYNTVLVGSKVVLIPYLEHHVEKYHAWMEDEALLDATASERLSLEDEYKMQVTWREDPRKLTWIILAEAGLAAFLGATTAQATSSSRLVLEEIEEGGEQEKKEGSEAVVKEEEEEKNAEGRVMLAGEPDELDRMSGDVNLFMHDDEDPGNAEIEIMIAEKKFRNKGFAKEALLLMMRYGIEHCQITRFFAKIHESNEASIQLFKSLGYQEKKFVEAFGEFELDYVVCEESRTRIFALTEHVEERPYL